jgi:CPA2 family monovalent cation:H+ antiporter-2
MLEQLSSSLLIVLCAGVVAGILCKQWGVSLIVGYLISGAIIGTGGLQLVESHNHEMEILAEIGALFLLFSIGIEFSIDDMVKYGKNFLRGGSIQLVLTVIVLTGILLATGQMTWKAAILLGFAATLSSTVMVFRALHEMGQVETPHGKQAVGVLLFQDVALVPLLLFVPLLVGNAEHSTIFVMFTMGWKSIIFIVGMGLLHLGIVKSVVPLLSTLRSVELIVLLALCLLGGICMVANILGLPPTIGALATGLVLSGNRLSRQIDSILLPFRETFAAVFFVSLGLLLQPGVFISQPLLIIGGIVGVMLIKTGTAAIALRANGLSWPTATRIGMGLSQMGEFSFLLAAEGLAEKLISSEHYNQLLVIALGTLILTPSVIKFGLQGIDPTLAEGHEESSHGKGAAEGDRLTHGIIIGVGPIGRQIASRLETLGVEITLVDRSPINLQTFAQAGFHTVTGDATDVATLRHAGAKHCQLAIVSVPQDDIALHVVRLVREMNKKVHIVVRCRFLSNVRPLMQVGANKVISEELEASGPIMRWCETVVTDTIKPTA